MSVRLRLAATMALAVALALGGCGDETGPGETGEARAVVTDNPDRASPAVAPGTQSEPRPASAGSFSGTLTADARVSISADGQSWIDLGSPKQIALQLQSSGDSSDVHGTVSVPVGTYSYVRLEMNGGKARVDGGSTIGGLLVSAAFDVFLGANQRVTIEKRVEPFTIEVDSRTTLLFELNSESWMTEENAQDKQVDEEEVEEPSEAGTRREEIEDQARA